MIFVHRLLISSCELHYEYVWISNICHSFFCLPLWFFFLFFKNTFKLGQISNTESELKKLAEENPDLQDAYIAKQKRLKVRNPFVWAPLL